MGMIQWACVQLAAADQTLEELVRTGVLTPEQAQMIREEVPQDSNTAVLLTSLGTIALAVVYLLVLSCTLTGSVVVSGVVNGAFALGFYTAGSSLESQGSPLLASVLLLLCYVSWVCCSFSVLSLCGLADYRTLEQHNFTEVPWVQQWLSLAVTYYLARSGSCVLVQLPFFLTLHMLSENLTDRLGPGRRHLVAAVWGACILLYTSVVGPAAFQVSPSPSDFQLMGCLLGALLLWRGLKDLPGELEGQKADVAAWLGLPAAVALLLLGFHIPSTALVYLSLKWLSEELTALWQREDLLRGAVAVTPLVLLFLIANHSLPQINDIFAVQSKQYMPEWLWTWVCYVLTLLSSGSALLFAQGVSDVPVQVDGKVIWKRALYKFCFCYALTLLLIVLAEEEHLWLLSMGYLVFALLTYGKVLGLLLDPELGSAVMVVLVLSGARIALVGHQFLTCLGLGAVLMGIGVFSLSSQAKTRPAYLLSLLLEGLLLSTALIVRSCLLFSGGLALGLQVVSVRLNARQMQLVVCVCVAVLSMYLVQNWDWTGYLEELNRGSLLRRVLVALGDPAALVPEKDLIRRVFEVIRSCLLNLAR